jgi:hypothetical protein
VAAGGEADAFEDRVPRQVGRDDRREPLGHQFVDGELLEGQVQQRPFALQK